MMLIAHACRLLGEVAIAKLELRDAQQVAPMRIELACEVIGVHGGCLPRILGQNALSGCSAQPVRFAMRMHKS